MKSRKKIIGIVTAAIILVCGIVGYTAANSESAAKLFGKKQAQVLANAGDGIVAIVDGEKITKKGFDTYKLLVDYENKLSDEEILEKIIDRQVVYNEAVKEGLLASDDQVEAAIKEQKQTVNADSKVYESFKEYVSGLNMTEDEYWENDKPVIRKGLTCGAYKNTLKQKFKKDNKIENANELNSKFSEFYNQKVKQLKRKAKVQSFIK